MSFSIKSVVLVIICCIGIYYTYVGQYGIISSKNYMNNGSNMTSSKRKYLSSKLAANFQLGNHIFELVSIVGIARLLHRTPVFYIENFDYKKDLESTNQTFPGLIDQFLIINGKVPRSIQETVFHPRCCIYEDPRVLLHITDEHIHLSGNLYQSYKYFDGMREEVLSWLKQPKNKYFRLPNSDKTTHVTCVHTRRGDFLAAGFQASDSHFIREAVKYIEKQEDPINRRKAVVILGDDVEFMKETFPDAVFSTDYSHQFSSSKYFISRNTPSDDILYSSLNCDIVLISASHSTFGWWLGYVSKYNKVYHMDMRVHYVGALSDGNMNIQDYFPPNWTPLKFSTDNITIIVGDK